MRKWLIKDWSRRSDSDRGPSAYRADALARLSYGGMGAIIPSSA